MGKRIVVNAGEKYHSWTAEEEVAARVRNGRSKRMVLCHCVCGKSSEVSLEDLRSGHSKSCGCQASKPADVGKRFGRWTVAKDLGKNPKSHRMVLVRCDCGTEKVCRYSKITSGKSLSCGCRVKKHGKCRSVEYKTWVSMKQRCESIGGAGYENYGARGIRVCDRWQDFTLFLEDMGERPKGHSIERRDVHKGYQPDNCFWMKNEKQATNTRRSIIWTVEGNEYASAQIASKATGLSTAVIQRRCRGSISSMTGRITMPFPGYSCRSRYPDKPHPKMMVHL